MLVTRDYFEQFRETRGLFEEDFSALSRPSGSWVPDGTDELCRFLHGLSKDIRIGVLSDFDCDGLMAGVVWYLSLRLMGFTNIVIGERDVAAGYGLAPSELDAVPGCPVIVTSDVGTSAGDFVEAAHARGVIVAVTDHHLADKDSSVQGLADYFVNPSAGSRPDGVPAVCGAMVVWLVASRYFELYSGEATAQILADLGLVRHFAAIATVSDAMPMRGMNREAVAEAVRFFSYMIPVSDSGTVNGLASDPVLQNVLFNFHFFVRGLAPDFYTGFDMDFLVYQVIPTINAVKRMGGSVSLVYGALFGAGDGAAARAETLRTLNQDRKTLVSGVSDELTRAYDAGDLPFSRVFVLSGVPGGVCGLVAQKMADYTTGPVAVFLERSDGSFAGSARSFGGYPFLSSVNESGTAFCAGHQEACGIFADSYAQLAALDGFLEFSFRDYETALPEVSGGGAFDVLMDFDADFVDFRRRLSAFWRECQALAPFGSGFPAPRVCLRTRIGNGLFQGFGPGGTEHVRMDLGRGLRCTLWNTDLSTVAESAKDGVLYVSGTLSRFFSGGRYVTDLAGRVLTEIPDLSGYYEERVLGPFSEEEDGDAA